MATKRKAQQSEVIPVRSVDLSALVESLEADIELRDLVKIAWAFGLELHISLASERKQRKPRARACKAKARGRRRA